MTEALVTSDADVCTPPTTGALARVLRRSSPATAAIAVATSLAAAPQAVAQSHTVRAGDTVSELALANGTTTAAITAANHLDPRARIRVGEVIEIPDRASRTSAATPEKASPRTHVVVAGDTVSALARRYGTSVSAISRANHLDSRALIRIGERLTIPGASGSASSSGASSGRSAASGSAKVGSTFAGRTYASSVVAAANANKTTLDSASAPSRSEARRLVSAAAARHGVSASLALAVAYQESGFDQRAVSPANAVGIMQVTPAAGDWAEMLTGKELNLLHAEDNVEAGVVILARLLATSPSTDRAIAGYYQGQTSVRRYGMFTDTRSYVASVTALTSQF